MENLHAMIILHFHLQPQFKYDFMYTSHDNNNDDDDDNDDENNNNFHSNKVMVCATLLYLPAQTLIFVNTPPPAFHVSEL